MTTVQDGLNERVLGRKLIAAKTDTEIASLAESYALGYILHDYVCTLTFGEIIARLEIADYRAQSVTDQFPNEIELSAEYAGYEDAPLGLRRIMIERRDAFIAFGTELQN